jgi:hypothetical protein
MFDTTKDVLIEIGAENLIKSVNLNLIKEVVLALKPIQVTLNAMSEKKLQLLLQILPLISCLKISAQDTQISQALLTNLQYYVKSKVNIQLVELISTLNNLQQTPSKSTLDFATNLMKRLFALTVEQNIEEIEDSSADLENGFGSLEEELQNRLIASHSRSFFQSERYKKLKQEFALSKSNGCLTENLKLLQNALNTIKPSSIDSERCFSIANNFCTKLRTRLSDKSLSVLVSLKYYFLNKQS